MGRWSFRQDTGDFFGTGMIVVDLRHVGMTAWLSKVLKISVRTSVSCSAQSFSTSGQVYCQDPQPCVGTDWLLLF